MLALFPFQAFLFVSVGFFERSFWPSCARIHLCRLGFVVHTPNGSCSRNIHTFHLCTFIIYHIYIYIYICICIHIIYIYIHVYFSIYLCNTNYLSKPCVLGNWRKMRQLHLALLDKSCRRKQMRPHSTSSVRQVAPPMYVYIYVCIYIYIYTYVYIYIHIERERYYHYTYIYIYIYIHDVRRDICICT